MDKLGIIVPYRNREEHLKKFIPAIHNYLEFIDFEIYIIEQYDDKPFNRGKLLNIGYDIFKDTTTYMAFHDIDMLPISADYSKPSTFTHLATNASQFGSKLPGLYYFGGVVLFNNNVFKEINGFSNGYWGWGAEDDDLLFRCIKKGYKLIRDKQGWFTSLDHVSNGDDYNPLVIENRRRWNKIAQGKVDISNDGLNTLEYKLISITEEKNYKLVKVKL